jgi:hypothetical protein
MWYAPRSCRRRSTHRRTSCIDTQRVRRLHSDPNYGVTVKVVALEAAPPGVVTSIFPVLAVVGTVGVIWLSLFTVKVPALPPKVTLVACVRPVPVMVTPVFTRKDAEAYQKRAFESLKAALDKPSPRS